MKYAFSAVAIVAFSGLVQAQADIPACAVTCLLSAISSATTCGATDYACSCSPSNAAAIQTAAEDCVISACGIAQAEAALTGAQAQCAAATGAGAAKSSSVASTTAAAPAQTSTASSSAASEDSSSAAPEASSAWSSSNTWAPSSTWASSSTWATSSSVAKVTTSATASATAPTSNGTYTTSTSPVQVTGGATQFIAGAGSVVMAGLAILAAF